MNPLNYCTLPAAQRLAEKRIVLKTEATWALSDKGGAAMLIYSRDMDRYTAFCTFIPAPSMAEAWRELKKDNVVDLIHYIEKFLGLERSIKFDIELICLIFNIDKVVDLLIWVTEQKGKEK